MKTSTNNQSFEKTIEQMIASLPCLTLEGASTGVEPVEVLEKPTAVALFVASFGSLPLDLCPAFKSQTPVTTFEIFDPGMAECGNTVSQSGTQSHRSHVFIQSQGNFQSPTENRRHPALLFPSSNFLLHLDLRLHTRTTFSE